MIARVGRSSPIFLASIVLASGCGGSRKSTLPAPVTLAGVGGVSIEMIAAKAARKFRAPMIDINNGSSADLYMPLCAGGMRGVARFFGPDTPNAPADTGLEAMWFTAGAKTDRGIGIGSTRQQVIDSYGARLHRASDGSLYIIGAPRAYYGSSTIRAVVLFMFFRNYVSLVGYGAHDEVLRELPAPLETAFC